MRCSLSMPKSMKNCTFKLRMWAMKRRMFRSWKRNWLVKNSKPARSCLYCSKGDMI